MGSSIDTKEAAARVYATRLRPLLRQLAGIAGSALLLGWYARGGNAWPLGFVALVPWLLVLGSLRSGWAVLASALAMAVAFEFAAFTWFAEAVAAYVGIGSVPAWLLLALLAPFLQPQVLSFALVRHWLSRRHSASVAALAAASAWLATEWLLPKLLGDTLGHGLLPSARLRQVADLGGAAGLSFLLLLVNEALGFALTRRQGGWRRIVASMSIAAALLVGMAGYGSWRLAALGDRLSAPAASVRVGLVQSNITRYEQLRQEHGAYAVIRHVLDTHYTMSDYAVHERGAEALLWSETVYPTTFGSPKSEQGAELDREILRFADSIGVPLVFGTYDLDADGEYNSAAFVEPGRGSLGHYRKTHLFPLTEYLPGWLDWTLSRRLLPWAGRWRAGSGARVMPLRTADGREVNVLPLICLDDVRSALAIDGARLGAQAILGLSNDSWFTAYPLGARLHLAVAAFRSIETRMPQLRVTSNGMSAIIDESGEVVAHTEMDQQAVLVGEIPVRDPPPTLMVRWGDWVGKASLGFLAWLALRAGCRRLASRLRRNSIAVSKGADASLQADVALLNRTWRTTIGSLRVISALGLAALLIGMLAGEGLQVSSLKQAWLFVYAVGVPAIAAWVIRRAFSARMSLADGVLILEQADQRIEVPLAAIQTLHVWRVALPGCGVDLQLTSTDKRVLSITLADPRGLYRALTAAGAPVSWRGAGDVRIAEYWAERAAATHRWLDHPLVAFVGFPLLPALPAFRLHQHIAFGGTFGEFYIHGAEAWLSGLAFWWVAWIIGLLLVASGLRVLVEAGVLGVSLAAPAHAAAARRTLERMRRVIYYLGIPAWLALRLLSG